MDKDVEATVHESFDIKRHMQIDGHKEEHKETDTKGDIRIERQIIERDIQHTHTETDREIERDRQQRREINSGETETSEINQRQATVI